MARLSDYKPDTRLFALFVGPASGGKSSAAISLPTKVKLYDFDLNAISAAAGTPWITREQKEGVDVTSWGPHKGIDEFVKELNMAETAIGAAAGKKDYYPFQTLVIDSLTSMSRVLMNEAAKTMTGGRTVGKGSLQLRLPGISDYNFKDEVSYQIFDWLRGLPVNIIVSAHTIPRYGRPLSEKWLETEGKQGKNPDQDFSEKVEIGEKLSITEKLGANVLSMFTEVYKFDKEEQPDGSSRYFVKFRGDLARTSHPNLPNGNTDITGKNFYEYWLSKIKETK